jgi:hypothetical protein
MIRTLAVIGGMLCLLACSKHSSPTYNQPDTAVYDPLPLTNPAIINFTIGKQSFCLTNKINYGLYDEGISINGEDGNGGQFWIYIDDTLPNADTVTTLHGCLTYGGLTGFGYVIYENDYSLTATAIFTHDTLNGSFMGGVVVDQSYNYQLITGTFSNIPFAQ